MALSLVTGPAIEPISIAEARQHLRVEALEDDELIAGLIAAARERAEAVTGRQLIEATYDLSFDEVTCDVIVFPRPPLRAIVSAAYLDSAGVSQTWTDYDSDKPAGPFAERGRLRPVYGSSWPVIGSGRLNAFTVRFTAGYGTKAVDVPRTIRQAMLLMLGAWYEQREDVVMDAVIAMPLGALALLTPYKVYA